MNHDEKIRTLDELSDFLDALDAGDAEARGALRWVEIHPAAKPQRPYPYRIVSTTNVSHCRGKRARRQAFYARQRMARMLRRIVWAHPIDLRTQADDMIRHGTTWLQVSDAGVRRVPPSEWRAPEWVAVNASTSFRREIVGSTPDGKVQIVDTFCDPPPC